MEGSRTHEGTLRTRKRPRDSGSWSPASAKSLVLASRERSLRYGVPRERTPDVPLLDYDPKSRLLNIARPVLDRLEPNIADASMSLLLTDARACIIERRVGQRRLTNHLDDAVAVPGALYNETTVGTNALGLAVEEKCPVRVVADEHFTEVLHRLTCIAVPIVNPLDGRLEGVLDVTCDPADASPLMLPVILEASRAMQDLFLAGATRANRILLDAFTTATRRSHRAVVLLERDLVITNAKAARLLQPDDQALLQRQCQGADPRSPKAVELTLSSGTTVLATIRQVTDDAKVLGTLVELASLATRPEGPRHQWVTLRADPLPGLLGRAPAWQTVCRAVRSQVNSDVAVAFVGEPGVGKLAVCLALHQLRGENRADPWPLQIVDAALGPAGHGEWLSSLTRALAQNETVVVRHVDALSPDMAAAAASVVMARREGVRVCATAGEQWRSTAPRSLVDQFPVSIGIPALRDRSEDIPCLVAGLLSRHGADLRTLHLTPEALKALAQSAWPGNLRELDGLLHSLLARRAKGAITVEDLPVAYRSANQRWLLPLMARAEYDAILRALAQCQGNKHDAARVLGISRSTLYRKLEAYGIDLSTS